MDTKTITLSNLGRGAAEERFQEALRAVIDNIDDPNTPAKAKRVVTMTFTFSPTDQRRVGSVRVGSTVKLPGISPLELPVFIGRERGQLMMAEPPGQEDMFAQPEPELAEVPAQPVEAGGPQP